MSEMKGFKDGDTVWVARVMVETLYGPEIVGVRPTVEEATVFLAEHGFIRCGDSSPRPLWYSEVVFRTRREAWLYCAERVSTGADALRAAANKCLAEAGVAGKAGAA